MKIQINLKDPDGIYESIADAISDELAALDLPVEERKKARDIRRKEIQAFLSKWISGSEYVSLEFDTETGMAKVLED